MDTATISRILRPFVTLSPEGLAKTSTYLDLLLKWNAKVNLTAVRMPEEIVARHFGESFFAAKRVALQPEDAVIDLGSGAGFPGVPLAVLAPEVRVTLIESQGKKAAFLNEVIFALQLKNAKVFSQRAEAYADQADLVIMRAVEKFDKALPVALGMVRGGGRIALMIGASQVETARTLVDSVIWDDPILVPGGHSRVLAVGTKPVIVE